MGRTIGVVSLKGGVGKTSSVVSLGHIFSELGKKVLLVDANLSAPNLGMHLKLVDPELTLHHVLARKAHIQDAIVSYQGMDILPSSLFSSEKINPLQLRQALSAVRHLYDVILIDSSPALNDETLGAMIASDELLVVSTPDYSTLSTTVKAIRLAKMRQTPINGLILNKVHNKKFELSLHDIERTSGVPVMAVVPHDTSVLHAQSEFTPLTRFRPRARASEEYRKLGYVLVGEKYVSPKRLTSYFGKAWPTKQEINREIFYNSVFPSA